MADRDVFGPCTDGNFVEFFTKEIKDDNRSSQEGRPIFYSQHWVKVWASGSKDMPEFPVDEVRAERYREQFDTWKRRIETGETGIIGTSLAAWPVIDRALAAGLREQGILSVEMLAAVKDSDIHRFGPGIRPLRQQAIAFLEAAKGQAPFTRMAKENEDLRNQLATLTQQMADVSALVREKGLDPTERPSAPEPADNSAVAAMQDQIAELTRAMSKMKPERRPYRHSKRNKAASPNAAARIAETEGAEA